jgi:hypothetical protein
MTISVLKVNAIAFKGVRVEQYLAGPDVTGVVGITGIGGLRDQLPDTESRSS